MASAAAATLSVSAPGMDCAEVAEALRQCGVRCDVTPNLTVLPGGHAPSPGAGCSSARAGRAAGRGGPFGGASASVRPRGPTGGYHGCVWDLERPSACPGGKFSPGRRRGAE